LEKKISAMWNIVKHWEGILTIILWDKHKCDFKELQANFKIRELQRNMPHKS
jgi:hypothetical protein